MLHVKQIREFVDAGEPDAAHEALDQLLVLGPNNTEALKLRARLFEIEGRFVEESKVWDRIAHVDREDEDAVAYILRRQLEDREHFYFTDDVTGGGRRFLAYPRSLVNRSAIGLLGCVTFLLASQLPNRFAAFGEPIVMLSMFGLFVIAPWIGILTTYMAGIKAVTLTPHGITVASRIRSLTYVWADLEKVCLARTRTGDTPSLSLVIMPKDRTVCPVEIDLSPGSTAIRARSYLIREIGRLFSEPPCVTRESLDLDRRKVATF